MAEQQAAWKGFLAGSLAGILSGAVTHPIDLIKVRMQLHGSSDGFNVASEVKGKKPGMISTAMNVARSEGILALYRGLSASLLRQATFIGTKIGSYDALKWVFADDKGQLGFHGKVACGLLAGAFGAAVGNPADLAMVRMQADGRLPAHLRRNYRHGGEAIMRVIREEGFFTLWRGCTPTVCRAMIITASQLAVYDQLKELILAHTSMEDTPVLHITASCIAATIAGFTSNPFDVVKSRLQHMKPQADGTMPYKGTWHCMVKTVHSEGFLALYKGLTPTIARQVPLNITRFVFLEQFRKVLAKI
eukprot:TRINITY_DN8677_c0_g1::TRINITY_DN8677_c0_g1_i1::g.427::m.427 TRINITY_DN8677_c0_g1::TRINITY_DN8677_c0_g1_i1::g.427  ORF type:complete len:304 (-),score=70.72,sp/Q9SB52/PUMP4_ARATH/46.79/2e-87,Mito_carr/PF00153.22/3.6e-21,Mito_carr/PF00153.22/1.4e-18,Mito_carr/PF00153.22/8.2e-24 TRINITY_DN8677_c0_g1_i1:197-1108(-)